MSPREKELARILQNLVDKAQWCVSAIELDHDTGLADEILAQAKAALAIKVRRPLSLFVERVLINLRGYHLGTTADSLKRGMYLGKESTGKVDKALRHLQDVGYASQDEETRLWFATKTGSEYSIKVRK